jgi:hypothetical protein
VAYLRLDDGGDPVPDDLGGGLLVVDQADHAGPAGCSRPRRCRSSSPATQIGVILGKITPVTAAALVCVGLLSVLIFPLLALTLLRRSEPAPAAASAGPIPEPHLM